MALISPHEGQQKFLEYMCNFGVPTNMKMYLFKNNIVPTHLTTLSDMTPCVNPTDYDGPITLTGGSWTVGLSGGVMQAMYGQQTFTFAAETTVYGQYITDNTSTYILMIDRFDNGPYLVPPTGVVKVTPTFIMS